MSGLGSVNAMRYSDRALSPIPAATQNTDMSPAERTELEAAAFRRLLRHLNWDRRDVQNIDLMILAGFCRNCLADWYREAAAERGTAMSKDEARETVYGMPFAEWKAKYQKEATPEQLAAFEKTQQHRAR